MFRSHILFPTSEGHLYAKSLHKIISCYISTMALWRHNNLPQKWPVNYIVCKVWYIYKQRFFSPFSIIYSLLGFPSLSFYSLIQM